MTKKGKHEKRHEGSHEPKMPQHPNTGKHKHAEDIPQNIPKKEHGATKAPKKKYDQ